MSVVAHVTGANAFASCPVVPIEAAYKPEDVRVVVFAQDRKTRAILGASSISLR